MMGGTLGETQSPLNEMDLIKTVRGLDQNGPGQNGENLDKLWRSLTASADGQFHAAEESTLRWLLKSMNGSPKDAETMRRWPLTWTILECVFQRIPMFSLAKSLADRRFIAVLQQTLKDISQPTSETLATTSSKRKRSTPKNYALEELKDQEGCLMAADAVFYALKRLLGRLEDAGTQASHDRIGAEHIRSLFRMSASEAASMAALWLTTCGLALNSDEQEQIEERETWIETISSIWDLHLQGDNDTSEVATHMFGPSSIILSKVEGTPRPYTHIIHEKLRARWTAAIQKFMHRNLLFPSRAIYLNKQDNEAISKALDVTKTFIEVSAPILYFLASGAAASLTDGRLRKGNGEWMKHIFKVVETSLREQPDRNELLQAVLERAAKLSMPVDTNDLRSICRDYALQEESTNWQLLADIAICDPDVFQLTEEGAALLKEVCERSTASKLQDSDAEAIARVINSVVQGFRTGRDFSSFLKLWFEQLGKVEKQKSKIASPWLQIGSNKYGDDNFTALVEKELSPQQVVELLEWVEGQKLHARTLCLFLNTLAQGIQSEAYINAVGDKMFGLVSQVTKSSSNLAALKWGVVSKTMSWVSPSRRFEIWDAVKKQLSKILSESSLSSRETFEAFKCSCQTWVSMSPDDEHIDEPYKLVEAFTNRLATELVTSKALRNISLSSRLELGLEVEFSEETALESYLHWFLRGSTRLNRLFSEKEAIPQVLQNVLSSPKMENGEIKFVWGSLLDNENNLNDGKVVADLIDRLVNSLEEGGKEKRWPAESSQTWIQNLGGIPTDAFTRPQRERIMTLLKKHRASTTKRISVEGWKMILSLSTKVMSRPTFYDDLKFDDNVEVADTMADLSSSTPTNDGTLSDLIGIFFVMASTTIRQMAEHIEERSLKYFEESRAFIADCDNAGDLSPFRLTLLKALVVETTKSLNCRSHPSLASLPQEAKDILGKCVMSATGYFLTEKKAFDSHNVVADLRLLAAVDAADALEDLTAALSLKKSELRKAEKRSREAVLSGDLRGWKVQTFLRTYFSSLLEEARPSTFPSLESIPTKLRETLLRSSVTSITKSMDSVAQLEYLKDLVEVFVEGHDADGQVMAIQSVVNQLIESSDLSSNTEAFDLATAHSKLVASLSSIKTTNTSTYICRTLYALLEKKPQSMTQWNIELTLSTVCDLCAPEKNTQAAVPFAWLCKLVEIIIKKHRLRLEGHHHLLMATMQSLLRNLVLTQASSGSSDQSLQEPKAHVYARLITLICEPTAGAVARSQHQSALDSATDAAKRSAGRHMYLVLMQYVKLQLEADVPRVIREALEPAMNSVFDITPSEVRKILNDAMDGSGRAILREMFKRYTKFGKWSGV